MDEGLFYKSTSIGFVVGLIIALVILFLYLNDEIGIRDNLRYQKVLHYTLADKETVKENSEALAALNAGRFIRQFQVGSLDSLFYLVNNLNLALNAFDGDEKDERGSFFNFLGRNGVSGEMITLAQDKKLKKILDSAVGVENIKAILEKKLDPEKLNYEHVVTVTKLDVFLILFIAQFAGSIGLLIGILNGYELQNWYKIPWGKPVAWILTIPGIIPYLAVGFILSFLGADVATTTKKIFTKSSPEILAKYSDDDTKNLADKLEKRIRGE